MGPSETKIEGTSATLNTGTSKFLKYPSVDGHSDLPQESLESTSLSSCDSAHTVHWCPLVPTAISCSNLIRFPAHEVALIEGPRPLLHFLLYLIVPIRKDSLNDATYCGIGNAKGQPILFNG